MDFDVVENKIKASEITLNGTVNIKNIQSGQINNVIVSTNTPLDQNRLNGIFIFTKLLATITPEFTNNNKTMNLTTISQTAEQFTLQNNFRNNQTQLAALFDSYAPVQQLLLSLDTREQLEEIIKPLLVAEIAVETQNLPLNHPYLRVFNHLSNLPFGNINKNKNKNNFHNVNSGTLFRCQSACSPAACNLTNSQYEFWFEGYYRAENISGDSNALGYKTSRSGMMVGVDRRIGNNLTTCLVFCYGNPYAYNSIAKIEADDYMFGTYARLKISEIYANAFWGYGYQNYELRRNLANNMNNNTKYNGDSMYASLEVFKPIRLQNNFTVSPLAAIDFQKSWADGFNVNVAGLPLSIVKSDLEQTVLRIGVNSCYKNLRTRLQYGYQVAGDLYGISRTSITGGNNSRILTGTNLGRNTLNVGFGGNFKIGKRTKLFADYDFDLGEHSTSHTGQFGIVTNF
ncbi:MAG: autotransporter outer membrane beta-barrel domain-containing protein [Planctomycetaceae bacterium]|jgi:hypothetical protein|nr:autotransporter outer membrane beta-barrel domain-containing protein [Planctomycetaceae bacterium]